MVRYFFSVLLTAIVTTGYVQAQQIPTNLHGSFVENFDGSTPEYFTMNLKQGVEDSRYVPGFNSQSENGTNVMLFRIDPDDPAGDGKGPEIATKAFTHFGTYAVRVKIPDVTKVQPNVGAVVSCFTRHTDNVNGLNTISIRWLIADPRIIYLGAGTEVDGNLLRVDRVINLANGIVYWANQPETVRPIENFNAAARFYTYGFDWYPDHIVWWINQPATDEKKILWEYQTGSTPGLNVPSSPSRFLLNFWHSNDSPVETNKNSIERPLSPYECEIDWISYTPFEE